MKIKLPRVFLRLNGLLALLLSTQIGSAQELNAVVQVSIDKVKANATNPRIFETLQKSAQEFLNSTRWTQDEYALEERIECSVLITIDKITSASSFEATIQISSNRPVYNSNYSSSLFNYRDADFDFEYVENAPIIFTENQHRDNLSSVLAFYAYYILAMDYDSFEREGGKPYYTIAQRIVANAQNSGKAGWNSSESTRNRFWMVDNSLQEAFEPLRQCIYEYHRMGLDKMYANEEEGRQAILDALKKLMDVHRVKPLSFNMQLFFTAKFQEIINIFSDAPMEQKNEVVNLVSTLDPSNITKYQKIKS
ncbi:MAG: DUF4835 family protein [Luteibaculum sp.]